MRRLSFNGDDTTFFTDGDYSYDQLSISARAQNRALAANNSNGATTASSAAGSSFTVGGPAGITFINTYDGTVSQAYINDIIAAENILAGTFTNTITIKLSFTAEADGTNTFGATNHIPSFYDVSYSQLVSALKSHAPSANAQRADMYLPANTPIPGDTNNTVDWSLPEAYARMLGFNPGNFAEDATITLNTSFNWSYGQDVINVLTHEISEGGMGRMGGLGDQNSTWSTMDLFRYASAGAPDYTDGRDGVQTYFSYNGGNTLTLPFNNEYSSNGTQQNNGDTADFTSTDDFGHSGMGNSTPNLFSPTDIVVMEVLGWNPNSTVDYFIASESKTGDYYLGYVIDDAGAYHTGSGFVSPTTDQLGGTWTYYVYAQGTSALPAAYSGYVYHTGYWDSDAATGYAPYYSLAGTNYLGSDIDYFVQNGAFQKYGGETYVPPDVKFDFFFAKESVTGDYYSGFVVDGTNQYSQGSGFTSNIVDQAGGHWSYYVYSTVTAPSSYLSQTGYVYETAYTDVDLGATYTPYYTVGGTNYLGTDLDFIHSGANFIEYGNSFYVVGGASGHAGGVSGASSQGSAASTSAQPSSISIADGATTEIQSAFSGAVLFDGSTGTLQLDNSSSFSGTVAGLLGQDKLDLMDIDPASVHTPLYSGDGSTGALMVTDGVHTANIQLFGDYIGSTFAPSNDGHGGTFINDVPSPFRT
jgi:hypothetical protein